LFYDSSIVFFYSRASKNRCSVSLGDTLEVPTSDGLDGIVRYKLHGVVYHIGDKVSEGHYIAATLCGNKWYKCDDSKVDELDEVIQLLLTLPLYVFTDIVCNISFLLAANYVRDAGEVGCLLNGLYESSCPRGAFHYSPKQRFNPLSNRGVFIWRAGFF
jgi:Ubiquitin carboxyl-terminal hydrolase